MVVGVQGVTWEAQSVRVVVRMGHKVRAEFNYYEVTVISKKAIRLRKSSQLSHCLFRGSPRLHPLQAADLVASTPSLATSTPYPPAPTWSSLTITLIPYTL